MSGWPAGGDARWRLRRQTELELLDQKEEFWLGLSVACQQQLAPVGRRQMDIDHLDGGKLLESASRSQSRRQSVAILGCVQHSTPMAWYPGQGTYRHCRTGAVLRSIDLSDSEARTGFPAYPPRRSTQSARRRTGEENTARLMSRVTRERCEVV